MMTDDPGPRLVVNNAPTEDTGSLWTAFLARGAQGPLCNLFNCMIALRAAPEISNCFAYDQMRRTVILERRLPRKGTFQEAPLPRELRDEDVSQLQEWLQFKGLSRISPEVVHQAVNMRAGERAFHPVRQYLDGLTWDGKPRLDQWLSTYLGAEPSTYHHEIGKLFIIAMVARIYRPGCKADYMLVLEGPQGARKSSACAILGGEWFSDALPELRGSGKDVMQHLNGKWLIEVPEMSAMDKADANALKSFITRREEKYRRSYGHIEVREPRQGLFVGTTNQSSYLQDQTGARRFWVVTVGCIDLLALEMDRSQLFAEAIVRFKAGDPWWPDAEFERDHIQPEQARRYQEDIWEDQIGTWLASEARRGGVTIKTIANEALKLETSRATRADSLRIARIMEHLGWRRGRRLDGYPTWEAPVGWKP